jgi:HSP20 family protein
MEFEGIILKSSWNRDGHLEPLSELENKADEIVVTFDLPRVRKEDIEINTTENTLEVIAQMSNAICWQRWGVVQRKVSFQSFRKLIQLPEPIEPEKVQASLKSGILTITLPKIRRKVPIRVE